MRRVLLFVLAPLAACRSHEPGPPPHDAGGPRVVRGAYVSGFETISLVPCDGGRWWIEGDSAVLAPLNAVASTTPVAPPFNHQDTIYGVFHGTLSDSGAFGHMGYYDRQFTLAGIDSVSRARPSGCSLGPPAA